MLGSSLDGSTDTVIWSLSKDPSFLQTTWNVASLILVPQWNMGGTDLMYKAHVMILVGFVEGCKCVVVCAWS